MQRYKTVEAYLVGHMPPSKRREYAEHVGEAKREATRTSRLEKSIPMILKGKGLYDKYKNC